LTTGLRLSLHMAILAGAFEAQGRGFKSLRAHCSGTPVILGGCHGSPNRISLREITGANRAAVERLGVTGDQERFVAGVAESLLEAAATPAACPWFRAVYHEDEPVGFVMISDGIPDGHPEYLGPYFLWRLLIDARWQGRGFGTRALELVVDYVRTRPNARTLLTSAVPGPRSPLGFYVRYGFSRTGQVFDGEDVLELVLPA
jgi:diamine N-acetyltransferase